MASRLELQVPSHSVVSFTQSLVPAGLTAPVTVANLGAFASSRQYKRVLSVAASQAQRLAAHGALRLQPGYDAELDGLIDDTCSEQLVLGAPCQLVGSGELVAYLGPPDRHAKVDASGETPAHAHEPQQRCRIKVIADSRLERVPRSKIIPLPTELARQGDWVVPVDLPEHLRRYYGHIGLCTRGFMPAEASSTSNGATFWVTFEPPDSSSPPEIVQLPVQNLVALPGCRAGVPLTPFEYKLHALGDDPQAKEPLPCEADAHVDGAVSAEGSSSEDVSDDEICNIGSSSSSSSGEEAAADHPSFRPGHCVKAPDGILGIVESSDVKKLVVFVLHGNAQCDAGKPVVFDTQDVERVSRDKLLREARCGVCGRTGQGSRMALCELYASKCLGAMHLECMQPPLAELPEGDWFCKACSCLGRHHAERARPKRRRMIGKTAAYADIVSSTEFAYGRACLRAQTPDWNFASHAGNSHMEMQNYDRQSDAG